MKRRLNAVGLVAVGIVAGIAFVLSCDATNVSVAQDMMTVCGAPCTISGPIDVKGTVSVTQPISVTGEVAVSSVSQPVKVQGPVDVNIVGTNAVRVLTADTDVARLASGRIPSTLQQLVKGPFVITDIVPIEGVNLWTTTAAACPVAPDASAMSL